MTRSPLATLPVLVLDCQASGATPAHGDLLEIGWAVTDLGQSIAPPQARWLLKTSDRPVSRPVRKLTGWDESCLEHALDPVDAWKAMLRDGRSSSPLSIPDGAIPTAIHFARFELNFLRDLHQRAGASEEFPLDVVCMHAIATRIFPDLPRLGLRALAGHLGHSADLQRRSHGHIEASLFIWRALVVRLQAMGIDTWDDLKIWLEAVPSSRGRGPRSSKTRAFPLPAERRQALPDKPGVYRFLRPNGDVLYVGKATSLKKRVASYFTKKAAIVERTLEMLTQAHDVQVTETDTALEAALLETDEIKRIDSPYNVQLRSGDRAAWFASRCWSTTRPAFDEDHPVGPLPSKDALSGISAMRRLLDGEPALADHGAAATGVPSAFAPPLPLFEEVWRSFAARHLSSSRPSRARILDAASRIVVVEKDEAPDEDDETPAVWDAATIERYLERTIVGEGRLVRRARHLSLLSEAHVAFRDAPPSRSKWVASARWRVLVIEGGVVTERAWVDGDDLSALPPPAPSTRAPSRQERLARFDAARYDRMRVLSTELHRIADQGGHVAARIGPHGWRRLRGVS